ncbi:hypothetical protein SAMN05421824_2854, partial [Hyunsoonleella jejuensis]
LPNGGDHKKKLERCAERYSGEPDPETKEGERPSKKIT